MPVQETVPVVETTPQSGAPTETTTSGARSQAEFIGEPEFDLGTEVDSELHPEPAEEIPTESSEGEPEATTEAETAPAAEGDNWLPTEQEKRFPTETLQKYAEKRGYPWEKNKDDPDFVRMLGDKLNSDIYLAEVRQREDQAALVEEEPTLEAEAKPEPAAATTPTDPRAAHYQRVDTIISSIDKTATEELGRNLLSAMGVNADPKYIQTLQEGLRNPNSTPQQRAEIQSHLDLAQNAGKIGGTLARGALDLVLTALPTILPDLIEQAFPGTRVNYETSVYQRSSVQAWDGLRTAKTADGTKPYADLPAFGTPEFRDLMIDAEQKLGLNEGELADMVFKGTSANDPKSITAAARKAYLMVAKIAKGQKVQPQAVAEAVATGKRLAAATTQRRAQGRVLGAGQGSRQAEARVTGDPMRDNLRGAIQEIADEDNWDRKR